MIIVSDSNEEVGWDMSEVTVFMPVYNAEKYLQEAIDSILQQTYKDFKLLIVEDGSTDRSKEILQQNTDNRIEIHYNEENKGIGYTRNRGLELCDTEYIAFMDADDIAPLLRLEIQKEYLENHPELIGVGGYAQFIAEDGERLNGIWPEYQNPRFIKANMILENTFANGSMMLRTKVIKKSKVRYNEDYKFAEDYRFYCELLHYGFIANMNEILQKYRVVSTGLTVTAIQDLKDQYLDEIHKYNFECYGFEFTVEEEDILLRLSRSNGKAESLDDLKLFFNALKSMQNQAEKMHLDLTDEIKSMCRKQFAKQVSKAFYLWEG